MNYEEETVADLKTEMEKRDLKVPYNATKADLTKALEKDDKETKKDDTKPTAKGKDDAPKTPRADFEIKGPGDEGGKRRLFQLVPNEKVWMTKAEAESHGLFWKDLPGDKKS